MVRYVTIRVRKEGVNFVYSMSLLKMSLSGRERGVEANLAKFTKFTGFFFSLPLRIPYKIRDTISAHYIQEQKLNVKS